MKIFNQPKRGRYIMPSKQKYKKLTIEMIRNTESEFLLKRIYTFVKNIIKYSEIEKSSVKRIAKKEVKDECIKNF